MEFIKKKWPALLMSLFLVLGFVFYIVAQTAGYVDGVSDSWAVMTVWIIVDIVLFGGCILGAFCPKFERLGKVSIIILVIGNLFASGVILWGQFLRINELGENSLAIMNGIDVVVGLTGILMDAALITGALGFILKGERSKKLIVASSILVIAAGTLTIIASIMNFAARGASHLYTDETNFYSYRDLFFGLMFIGFGFGLLRYFGLGQAKIEG